MGEYKRERGETDGRQTDRYRYREKDRRTYARNKHPKKQKSKRNKLVKEARERRAQTPNQQLSARLSPHEHRRASRPKYSFSRHYTLFTIQRSETSHHPPLLLHSKIGR